ncbi:hypothetical protein ACSTJJ_23130, partial [Vibrio parahaemolyticus]
VTWNPDEGERPRVLITRVKETVGEGVVGVGDRVLARVTRLDAPDGDFRFQAHIVKRLMHERGRMLGIFRKARAGGGGGGSI